MKNIKDSVPLLHIFLILHHVLVLLIFCLSFPFPVDKHHNNLFHSTYEFIGVVKSSRLAAFFIFNAIVVTIFFVSFRPSFKEYDSCWCIPVSNTPANYQAHDHHHRDLNEHDYDDDDGDYGTEGDNLYHGNSDGYNEDNDDNDDGDDDSDDSLFGREEDCGYEYDDEEKYIDLQRRSDEFIAQNNKRWTEELRNEGLLCIAAPTEILTSSSS